MDQATAALRRTLDLPLEREELARELRASFAVAPPRVLPGVRELIAALGAEVPLAVATNGPPDLVDHALEKAGLRPAFATVVSAEDVGRPKPDPAVYLEACRRLGVAPTQAVAFEDSALGAQAARAAGCVVVLAPSAPGVSFAADLTVADLADPRIRALVGLDRATARDAGD